jgi:hypothetical protein
MKESRLEPILDKKRNIRTITKFISENISTSSRKNNTLEFWTLHIIQYSEQNTMDNGPVNEISSI